MSRSTAEEIEKAEIRVRFMASGHEVAMMRLAGPATTWSHTEKRPDTDAIDCDNSSNIDYIDSEDDINDTSTIQVYSGNDPSISRILLLEDTRYEIQMDLTDDVDRVFPFLRENSDTISLNESYFGNDRCKTFTLQFVSYVGRGFFDITYMDGTLRIPFEVRSRKLGYRTEYPRMLSDITDFSMSILLQMKSPLFRYYDISEDASRIGYEDFLVLDYIFGEMHLPDLYEYVRNHRHYNTVKVHETVPSGLSGDVDDLDLARLLSGDNLIPMRNGPICSRYAPLTVDNIYYEDDYDTSENRVVKDMLLTIKHMTGGLRRKLRHMSDYIRNRLDTFHDFADMALTDPWLMEVGALRRIPFESTVLQSKHGYSGIFEAYQILGLGAMFKQSDIDGLLKGHGSKVSQVYEYWCYTRLYRCLYRKSSNKPEFPTIREGRNTNITINNRKGTRFEIKRPDGCFLIDLYYNREFNMDGGEFRSYSVKLRPDYTLVIRKESEKSSIIINFDAKYKLKPVKLEDRLELDKDSECWMNDLYKMHTYRDALIGSFGSYVLYPGRTGDFFVKPRKSDWKNRKDDVIPSVGSIQMIPGLDWDEDLDEHIDRILDKVSGVLTDYELIDSVHGNI